MNENDFNRLVIRGLRIIIFLLMRKYDKECEVLCSNYRADTDKYI